MEPSLIVIAGWVKQRACILKSQLPDDWSPSFSCCIHLLGPRNWLASRRPHGGSHCKGVRPSFLSQHKKCSIHFPVKKDLRASNPIWWRRRLIETQRQRYRDDRCVPETESQRFEKSKEEFYGRLLCRQLCPAVMPWELCHSSHWKYKGVPPDERSIKNPCWLENSNLWFVFTSVNLLLFKID